VDREAPQVWVTSPAENATVSGTITAAANATDDVGVVGVQFRVDGANFDWESGAPFGASLNTTTLTNGVHTITASARDASGASTTSAPRTIIVNNSTADNTAPQLSITAPSNGASVSSSINITATASDNDRVAGVQFKLDGANLGAEITTAPYTRSWDTRTATNGSHTIVAIARDPSGNSTTKSVAVTVNNDLTPPTISFSSPANGASVSATINVAASASDNVGVVGVQLKLDGAVLGAELTSAPYTRSWDSRTTTNGSHTLTAVARDLAGNTQTATVTVTVSNDPTPPTVSITAPGNGSTVTGTINVTASAGDNVGVVGVQLKLDGANLGAENTSAPYSRSWDTRGASNGSHTLSAIARDQAGNSTTATITVTVSNDATPPTVSFSAPAAGATVSGTVDVSASASDNVGVVGVQFSVNGIDLGGEDTSAPYQVSWNTTSLANGQYTLTAVARDATGNASTTSRTVTVSNSAGLPPALLVPSSVVIRQGSLSSGNAASAASDDNNYLVTRSAFSGLTALSQTELVFTDATGPVSRLDLLVRVKSTTSNTRVGVSLYNVTTGSWQEFTSTNVGSSETTLTASVTSSPGSYIDASGKVTMRISTSKLLSSHSISIDRATVTVVR
jgi:hypothetical protein